MAERMIGKRQAGEQACRLVDNIVLAAAVAAGQAQAFIQARNKLTHGK